MATSNHEGSSGARSAPERDFRGYGRYPQHPVRWPGGAKVALCLVVNYEAGAEYTLGDGDKLREAVGEFGTAINPTPMRVRDLCTESTFEYGARAGVWRLARIFEEFGIQVTFHLSARAVERNPEVGAYIREAGHEPCAHGYRWEELWRLSRAEEEAELKRAVASIEMTCGRRPVGWYSRCTPSEFTRELVVAEGGFLYDSDAYNDDIPYMVSVSDKPHLVIPYSFVFNDMKFIFPPGLSDPMSFFNCCAMGLDDLLEEGEVCPKIMTVGLHPRWIGQPGRARAVRKFLDYARGCPGVWFARREDVARAWLSQGPGKASG